MNLSIAKDFSEAPAGREYPVDGHWTGDRFRREYLEKYLRETKEKITINLDGTLGLPSSFLDEAFGGLVKECGYNPETLKDRLSLVALVKENQRYIDQIWGYIQSAKDKQFA